MRRWLVILGVLLALGNNIQAQELNAKVVVNTSKISTTKTEVFEALKEKIEAFLNDQKWTTMNFKEVEKIACNLNVTVDEWKEDENSFKCTLMLTSNRPVYGSSYTTPLYNVKDGDFDFNFQTTDQLVWNPEYIDNNLTAMLAYYAYMIIGYDMDSMAPLGGTTYLRKAEDVVTNSQSLGFPGWSSFSDSKNRFGLLNDYIDGSMEDYRQMIYKYHREGLDHMAENPEEARLAITEAIDLLDACREARTMSQLPQLFAENKRDELVNIYTGHGEREEKERVSHVLLLINTSMREYWEKIMK